ncbi:hypothetical protein LSI54_04010 [Nesterenkonia sp. AY15]|uniref:hypothetical protein n=1 Tax=Nesterenkonia sp. AY15 TaxID=2901139 RepID=UPI001F4CEBEB|nr:hypothetical protein [Nesterenkonia sp. AY15]MCH8570528.1 hypothetical protein [Nesterenkonia sp. AY15]
MASATTTARNQSRTLLLVAALLNLVPPTAFALPVVLQASPEQFSLVAATGSLAAALCTLYALRMAALPRRIRMLLGGVAVLAAAFFIGGDAAVRAIPAEGIGPGLIPFMGMLLHLCAAATLFTLGLVHPRSRTAARQH